MSARFCYYGFTFFAVLHCTGIYGEAIVIKKLVHDSILLPCYAEKLGDNNVKWFKDGNLFWERHNATVELPTNIQLLANQTLELTDLGASDAGDYTCQVIRPEPWGPITQEHTIEVLYPPEIRTIPESNYLEVELGQEVEMGCVATGFPAPVLTWSYKGKEIQLRDSRVMLKFKATDRKVSGNYQCAASNGVGDSAAATILLKVIFPPEVGAVRLWVHSAPNQNAALECDVFADPVAKVEWFHEGREVDFGERMLIYEKNNRHILLIRNVLTSDFGFYTCKASNFLGRSQQSIQLSGVAHAAVFKRSLRTSYPHNYTLIWEVDSYSPIIEYSLLFRKHEVYPESSDWSKLIIPAESDHSASIHSMSYTLTGLSIATTYEATVLSRNRFGWSHPSSIFRFSTLGADKNLEKPNLPTSTINSQEEEPLINIKKEEELIEEVEENILEPNVRGAIFSDQITSNAMYSSKPECLSLLAIILSFIFILKN